MPQTNRPETCMIRSFLVLVVSLATISHTQAQVDFYAQPGVTSEEILEARGFPTRVVYLTTDDGYKLKLVHAWNPLISRPITNRVPLLFIHGILEDSSVFVINSMDVPPRDFSFMSLSNSTVAESIINDPAARSLPILALNFGHPVYLLNRRGAPGSQEKIARASRFSFPADLWNLRQMADLSQNLLTPSFLTDVLAGSLGAFFNSASMLQQIPFSYNSDFWDYSLDEQAKYDFPLILNYVSEQHNGSKVSVVTHSAGGAIQLMSMAERPELDDKISSSILWAEGFTLGFNDAFEPLSVASAVFENYKGSIPPAFSSIQLQAFLDLFCISNLAQRTLCSSIADLLLGPSGGREPITPEFINTVLYPSSSKEFAQNLQCVSFGGVMHKYDYRSSQINQDKYGQSIPPPYDLRRITSKTLSFYTGMTDFTVSTNDVRFSSNLLEVPYKFHAINDTFNHQGFFYHDDNARLAIVPSLIEIHQFAEMS